MKVKGESEIAQPCPTLSDPMDCSPPGSSVHGIFQARVLEWGAIALSRDQTQVPRIVECGVLATGLPGKSWNMFNSTLDFSLTYLVVLSLSFNFLQGKISR